MRSVTIPSSSHRSSRRLPRLLASASVIALAMLVIVQTGVLQRLPAEYVPDAVEPYIGVSHEHILANAFLYQQQRPLSCEYASTTIAAQMGGWELSEYDFDALVPLHENPHVGYRGNILGEWGNTIDYGIYPEPLHEALSTLGIPSTVIYADGDADVIKHELQAGNAVVVWLAMRGAENSVEQQDANGANYQLTQYMHVMTAYGYDADGVYLSDPGTAVWRYYDWPTFMAMWNVMDGMALSVESREITALTDTFSVDTRYVRQRTAWITR